MSCSRSRLDPGAAALAMAIACSAAPLLAQSTDGDPAADTAGNTAPLPPAAPAIAPFAVVHPTYQPSRSAVDDQPAPAPSRAVRSVKRRPAPVAAVSPDRPEAEIPPVAEVPPVVDTPPVAVPRQLVPAATDEPRSARLPGSVTLAGGNVLRLIAAAAIVAIVLAGAGLALGRRSGRRAGFPGAVAKTPTWQAVMPPDLAGPTGDATATSDLPGGRRVKPGRALDDRDDTASEPHAIPAAKRAAARGRRVVDL